MDILLNLRQNFIWRIRPFFISSSFISDVQMQAFIPVATPVKDFPATNCLHLYP